MLIHMNKIYDDSLDKTDKHDKKILKLANISGEQT